MKRITTLTIDEQIDFVEDFICSKFLITREELLSKHRSDVLAVARRASMFILIRVCKIKGKDVAKRYRKTAVTHQVQKTQKELDDYDASYSPLDAKLMSVRIVRLFIAFNN